MNKIIIYLVISDILILSAFGLIAPIFAIYMEGLSGGITAAGIASMVFLAVKSLIQLPLSIFIDKKRSKIGFLIIGTLLIVIVPIMYALSKSVTLIYVAQGIYGIGAAMAYPAWYSLFTMHLDKKHRGLEYSVWATSVGLGTALTAYLGAEFAQAWGFNTLFYLVAGISFVGLTVLFLLSKKYLKDVQKVEGFIFRNHNKH